MSFIHKRLNNGALFFLHIVSLVSISFLLAVIFSTEIQGWIIESAERLLNKNLDYDYWHSYLSSPGIIFLPMSFILVINFILSPVLWRRSCHFIDSGADFLIKIKKLLQKHPFLRMVLVLVILIPFIITILFSTPTIDDFGMACIDKNKPLFYEAARVAKEYYYSWGGGAPYTFCEVLFNPLISFNASSYNLGIELVMLFLLYVFVLFLHISVFTRIFLSCDIRFVCFSAFCLFLFSLLNSQIYHGVFYWYVGSSYLLGLVFTYINQILVLKYLNSEGGIPCFIVLCLIGFIACFMLTTATFSGIIYLIEYFRNNNKAKNRIVKLIPLFFMITGGLISVLAPGNWARREATGTEFSIGLALLNTFKNMILVLFSAVKPVFFVMIVASFVIGFKCITDNNSIVSFRACFIGLFISLFGLLFPLALGYGTNRLPDRAFLLANSIIYIWVMLIVMKAGIRFRDNYRLRQIIINREYKIIFCVVFIAILIETGIAGLKQKPMPWIETAANIRNVKLERDYNMNMIRQILESEDKELVLVEDKSIPVTNIINRVGLSDDPSYFVNKAVAEWSNKETIVLINNEENE